MYLLNLVVKLDAMGTKEIATRGATGREFISARRPGAYGEKEMIS